MLRGASGNRQNTDRAQKFKQLPGARKFRKFEDQSLQQKLFVEFLLQGFRKAQHARPQHEKIQDGILLFVDQGNPQNDRCAQSEHLQLYNARPKIDYQD